MKNLILLGAALVLLPALTLQRGEAQGKDGLHRLMLNKLKNSQAILEGLALNDLDKISRSADELVQISRTAEWFVLKTPKYELHSDEFRRAANNIVRKAREKNLDGAALAYFDMTMVCLRCHQYVREVRDARAPVPPDRVPGTAVTARIQR